MPAKCNYKLVIHWEETLKGCVEIKAKNEKQARALFNQNPSEYLENIQITGHAYPFDMLDMRVDSIERD
jgi:hypothetical protein